MTDENSSGDNGKLLYCSFCGKSQNEVEFHNGAVARTGQALGVPTPVNGALNDILMKLARKEIDFEIFNGKPKQLVAAVRRYQQSQKR